MVATRQLGTRHIGIDKFGTLQYVEVHVCGCAYVRAFAASFMLDIYIFIFILRLPCTVTSIRWVRCQCAPCHQVRALAIYFHHFSSSFFLLPNRESRFTLRPTIMITATDRYAQLLLYKVLNCPETFPTVHFFCSSFSETISNWIWKCRQSTRMLCLTNNCNAICRRHVFFLLFFFLLFRRLKIKSTYFPRVKRS